MKTNKYRISCYRNGSFYLQSKSWWWPFWIPADGEWSTTFDTYEQAEEYMFNRIKAEAARKVRIAANKKQLTNEEYDFKKYVQEHPEEFL